MSSSPCAEKRVRVLVVDDEEPIRLRAARTLLRESMEVRGAGTMKEAVDVIERWQPEALIVDLLLEDDSGFDVIRAFRESAAGSRGSVIVLSALHDFKSKLDAMRLGSDAFFTKPVDWDSVARRLLSLHQRRSIEHATRILLVEDDPVDATRLRTMLGANGYQMLLCSDPATFEDDLDGFQPDLILLDINLPGVSGFELARFVRQHERHAATPIIFLTSDASEASRVEAIMSGGDDHITKPPSEDMLVRSIESRINRSRTVKALLERDGLTGLLTHAVMMTRIGEVVLERQRNPERLFSIALLDLDHFKSINDTYGHVVGDKVLASLSAFLRAQLRATDIIGRYGGEEFVVVLPDADATRARELLEKLLESFSKVSHESEDGRSFHVTFSVGVAALESGWSGEEWKIHADQALYRSKLNGRNQVTVARGTPRKIEHTTGVLDPVVVASLRELGRRSNTDLLSEIAELFLRISPERVDSLRTAFDGGDCRTLEMTAHAFRSAAANLGAAELAGYCERIEALAGEKDIGSIAPLMEALENEYERVTRTLLGLRRPGQEGS